MAFTSLQLAPKSFAGASKQKQPTGADYVDSLYDGESTFNVFSHYTHLAVEGKMPFFVSLAIAAPTLCYVFPQVPVLTLPGYAAYFCGVYVAARFIGKPPENPSKPDMTGKTAVVLGGTGGLGSNTTAQLLRCNYKVVCVSTLRQKEAAEYTISGIAGDKLDNLHFMKLDITDYSAVRDFPKRYAAQHGPQVDLLVNLVGVMDGTYAKTKHKDDAHLAVNTIGPYLLTEGFIPFLKETQGRFVTTSSIAHTIAKGDIVSKYLVDREKGKAHLSEELYGTSKIGNIFHAQLLAAEAKKLAKKQKLPKGVSPFTVAIAHVPPTNTNIFVIGKYPEVIKKCYYLLIAIMCTPWEGSQTVANCCLRPDIINGMTYFKNKAKPAVLSQLACEGKLTQRGDLRQPYMQWIKDHVDPYIKTRKMDGVGSKKPAKKTNTRL